MSEIKIAPSILSADFARLGEQVREATEAGADYIHVDIMDGHFVPNITVGPDIVNAIRPWTDIPLDVHMMVEEPGRYISQVADAGADIITVHAEACVHLHKTIHQIIEANVKPSVAVNPGTPVSILEDVLGDLDQVVVMSVNPGLGGQSFIESSFDKISRMQRLIREFGSNAEIEVDGGIKSNTVPRVVSAGATVLVAGSAVFNDNVTVAEAIVDIRSRL
ncbi:MAG: ribulose-phosphate 3-epimerase [Chloroflexota bacterium]|nr:ribulose-phosphate 3-epimerase [Chloroflexota bacterium]